MDALLGEPRSYFDSGRGVFTIWIPVPGVLVTRCKGHVDIPIARAFIEAGNDVVAQSGRITGFHDWFLVNDYASEARNRLTQWGHDIRAKVDKAHFLTGSPIVRMGISVASIVLKDMLVTHTERGPFENELRAALRARKSLLPPAKSGRSQAPEPLSTRPSKRPPAGGLS